MRRSSVIIVSILVVAALAWTALYFGTPGTPLDATFVVESSDSAQKIVDRLVSRGFVRSRLLFKIALKTSGLATHLQPGTYTLADVHSYEEIIIRLSSGGIRASEFTLKIIEGWDLRDIKKALESAGYAQANRFYEVTGLPATDHRTLSTSSAAKPDDFSNEFLFLKEKPSYVSLEGYLFPDTYRIFKDATAEELVKTLLANFDRKITPELRAEFAAHSHSMYQVVTMASIIEKEVRGDGDKRKVADIFWRRLARGMALQADSTVNYVTGKDHASVLLQDTKNVSRYNTYKYPGLPLGPIDNPSISSIRAAIDPEPNNYWFFLTDKDGAVHYASTFDEHNRNKARYLR